MNEFSPGTFIPDAWTDYARWICEGFDVNKVNMRSESSFHRWEALCNNMLEL